MHGVLTREDSLIATTASVSGGSFSGRRDVGEIGTSSRLADINLRRENASSSGNLKWQLEVATCLWASGVEYYTVRHSSNHLSSKIEA